VVEGSSAAKAGIKAGDVIVSINGKNVANATELRNTIGLLRIGDKVEVGLIRDGSPRRVTAVVGERADSSPEAAGQIHPAFEGAALANADNNGGVVIRGVTENSPAAQNGLRPNDVIVAIGRVRITNLEQLRTAIRGANSFAITIVRGNSTLVFPIG
jgi:S1-C subfamily serine protease